MLCFVMVKLPILEKNIMINHISRVYFIENTVSSEICTRVAGALFGYDHYDDVIMGPIASQITSLMIVYSTFYSDADQRKQ